MQAEIPPPQDGQTGLPDYVGDHFNYVIKAPGPARLGEALFFGSSLALPVIMGVILLSWSGRLPFVSRVALIVTTLVFGASMIWYLVWMQNRLKTFRNECPSSYERWYGLHRQRSFGGSIPSQLRLAKLQARYLFLGKEPSQAETLALTMRLSRRS